MNRDLYKQRFTVDEPPDYICPKCNIGLLRIKENSFEEFAELDAKEMQNKHELDQDWIDYIFHCIFECNNHKCASKVVCTGRGNVDFDIDVDEFGSQSQYWYSDYRPLFFHPNLKLITIPEDTPADIEKLLNQSFELFFTSPSAAANLIRISIEEILTDQGVDLYSKKDDSKKMSLHSRIKEHLPDKYQTIKEHLEAVKWLGNAGSHSSEELSLDDTMDAYELVEYVLSEIYRSTSYNLDRLTQEINTFKGPRGNRRLSN